jgi:RNA polymerase sigma-70 factor (ECF subfamily)
VQAETDRELVLLMQRGDLDALGALYDRHHQRVYRTALGITNDRDAASDLLQDVFLRVYRFAKRIDPDRPLEPWLYRVTANLAYTHIKRRNRWYRYLFEIGDWFNRELSPGPQRQLEMDEEAARVRKAVASLPISQRMVVVLYYLNDLPIDEIAEVLDIPEGTVKSRLFYARNTLRKRLTLLEDRLPQVNYEFS